MTNVTILDNTICEVNPNPTRDIVRIQSPAGAVATAYNSLGQKVIDPTKDKVISLGDLPDGTYMFVIDYENRRVKKENHQAMRYIATLLLLLVSASASGQAVKKALKFATFYTAFSGGNSISDQEVFSVGNGLQTDVLKTPFDYSFTAGIRKIARFGYENRANAFYNGTEKSYGDAATIGKVKGFEFLFEGDYRRQQGINYLDQDHFLRYVGERWITKVEYLQDGFADVSYFEGSQRVRANLGKLSLNAGIMQRLSEPYGYDPLNEWLLDNNQLHFTSLALQEGYNIDVNTGEFFNPQGEVVANSYEVWEEVVVPQVLDDYVTKKRGELSNQWVHSFVVGFDYYHFTRTSGYTLGAT